MVKNEYYELDYNSLKNQINWTVKGFWPSVKVVPTLEQDWNAILQQAKKPGFKILANLADMKTPPDEVAQLHSKIQGQIISSGVHKIGTVVASAVTSLAIQNIGRKSGVTQYVAQFSSKEKAQAWLDEK